MPAEPSRRSRTAERIFAESAILVGIAIWWLTARDLPAFVLPSPLEVLATLSRFFTETTLAYHAGVSALRVFAAVTLAMTIAVAVAAVVSRHPLVAAVVEERILVFLNSFPSVGWAILGVIWFQVSNATVIFIEAAIILPFCLINAIAGFRQIDAELDEMGRSFSRSRWRRFTRLTLPLIAPFLLAGLRIAYGICWKIALVAELFGAQSGLGFLLVRAQASADASMIFATCLVIVAAVMVVDRLVLAPLARAYSINKGASA